MNKIIYILILISTMVYAQPESKSNQIKIDGAVKCNGDCGPVGFEILVLDSANEDLGTIECDTYKNPYKFVKYVRSPKEGSPILKVNFLHRNDLGAYPNPIVKYHGDKVTIKVKEIRWIRGDYKNRAEDNYSNGRYEEALNELRTFRNHRYPNSFDLSHDFEWTKLISKCLDKMGKEKEAIEELDKLLDRRENMGFEYKLSVFNHQIAIASDIKDYNRITKVLDEISGEIGLSKLNSKDLKSYFKERLTNILLKAKFYDPEYRKFPGKFMADSLDANGSFNELNKSEWEKFYRELNASRLGRNLNDTDSLLDQITSAISTVDN